jgi:ribosomal protein S18 acetylase RimI-like enzyme
MSERIARNRPLEFVWREVPTARDLDGVRALVDRTRVFSQAEIAIAAELVEEALRCGAAAGYEFVFVERDEQLAGYTCFGAIPGTLQSHDLYWIAVDPDQHGLGLGAQLLARSEARIAQRAGRHVWVDTSSRPDYAPAHRLYSTAGYRQVARLDDFYAPKDAKLIFTKALAARVGDDPLPRNR